MYNRNIISNLLSKEDGYTGDRIEEIRVFISKVNMPLNFSQLRIKTSKQKHQERDKEWNGLCTVHRTWCLQKLGYLRNILIIGFKIKSPWVLNHGHIQTQQ